MKIKLTILSLVVLLGACTQVPPLNFSPADVSPTGVKIDAELRDINIAFGKKEELLGVIEIGFTGHQYQTSFKSLFEDALQETIIKSAIFNDLADRKVFLTAKVMQLDISSTIIDFKINTDLIVRYQLLDTSSGRAVFTRDIISRGSFAEISLIPLDFATAQANFNQSKNIAVRKNILLFIDSLAEFKQ